MHPKKARSESFLRVRETSLMQSLGASDTPKNSPGVVDARSSLHLPQDNLGDNKPGVACRVDKHSRGSLQKASFQAQELAESSYGAPAWKGHMGLRRSLSYQLFLSILLWRRVPDRSFNTTSLPPPNFGMWSLSLELRFVPCNMLSDNLRSFKV